jgi:hypothetical protein
VALGDRDDPAFVAAERVAVERRGEQAAEVRVVGAVKCIERVVAEHRLVRREPAQPLAESERAAAFGEHRARILRVTEQKDSRQQRHGQREPVRDPAIPVEHLLGAKETLGVAKAGGEEGHVARGDVDRHENQAYKSTVEYA